MSKPKVFITKPIPKEAEAYISQYCDYEIWSSDKKISREYLIEKLSDIDGLLTTGFKIDEELLSNAPNLKVVSNISVGYNNFDINAMKSKKVLGTNTPNVLNETVSDLVFALMLSAARRTPELDLYVKQGKWKKDDGNVLFGVDVHHATLGIIGMGRIGEFIAKKAKLGFDMNILYYDKYKKASIEESIGIKYAELETLLKESDYVVLMIPLTKDTYQLINYKEFEIMKKSAIFINTSRGETVNEEALIDALKNKKILAAGLDVYNTEPINMDNPLLKLSNVVTTPHIGSATEKTRFDMAMLAAKNLVKAVMGEVPPNIVPELKIQ